MAGGLFDDVPNVGGGQMTAAAPAGLFADVGADPVAAIKWGDIVDPKQAKAQIDTLPEPARQRARDIWATSAVARDREGGGVMQRVDDGVRRFAKAAPGIGSWADELNAWTASVFGSDYDLAHAYERAKDRAIDAAPTQKLGTLPLVGDVTTGGLEQAAGVVAGAVALPMAKLVRGGSAVLSAVNVAANAGAVGAVQGAGEGTTAAERATNAVISGGLSAAGGAVLGGAIGKLTGAGAPAAVANRVASNEAAAAAQRVGVDLPVAAAGTPNGVPMMVGSVLKEVPVAGAPLVAAVDKAAEQLATAGQRIADKVTPGATPLSAGEAARNGITQWIKTGSAKELDNLYSGVQAMVPATATRPLAATRAAAQTLLAADDAAASSVNGRAVAVIEDAITRPQGLTYEGLMQLRTNVGHMIDDGLLPEAGTMKPALKRIYGALSDDLKDLVRQAGGRPAEAAWTRANNATRIVEHQREALTRIVGFEGKASPEQVLDRLVQYAGSRGSADVKALIRARNVLPPAAWDEVSAAAIGRLGRNQSNDFSPAIFLKNYSALSQNGKSILFGRQQSGATLRNDLDALARTAESYQNLSKLQNSSGSGRVVVGAMALFSGTLAPAALPFIALKGIGARMMAQALAKPVTVKPVNRFAQNLYNVLESGKGQAALKFSTLTLAKVLADKVGGNEKEIAAAIERDTAALLAPATSTPAPGGGGPAVPPSSPVGTPGQPVAPGGADTLEAAPNDQAERAAFLSSEKDRRPFAETLQRGVALPMSVSGYNSSTIPLVERTNAGVRFNSDAIPMLAGGGGLATFHNARTGQNSVTQAELDSAATDLAGVAMTGTIAGRAGRAPQKPVAPPPPSREVAPPPPPAREIAPPPPSREVAPPPPGAGREGQTVGGATGGVVESVQKSGAEAQGHKTNQGGPSAGQSSGVKPRNQREKIAEQKFELDEWRAAYFAATGKHASRDWPASVVQTKTKAAWGSNG